MDTSVLWLTGLFDPVLATAKQAKAATVVAYAIHPDTVHKTELVLWNRTVEFAFTKSKLYFDIALFPAFPICTYT